MTKNLYLGTHRVFALTTSAPGRCSGSGTSACMEVVMTNILYLETYEVFTITTSAPPDARLAQMTATVVVSDLAFEAAILKPGVACA
jgi:hypothetical protein